MDERVAIFDMLHAFRARLYACIERRTDALFELTDAILTAGPVPSSVHLSFTSVHRRGWGSLYAALSKGDLDRETLRELLVRFPLSREAEDYRRRRRSSVDISFWPRCDAEASPERGFYYHPSKHSAGQPIVAGWAYQWIAELGFARESWVAPIDAHRVRPQENTNLVAVEQVKALLCRLPYVSEPPLFVFDAGYDAVRLTQELAGDRAQVLVRLNSRCYFYADPSKRPGGKGGRPRWHGSKFACKDPSTWPGPTHEHTCHDQDLGEVRVRAWSGLHPKIQSRPHGETFEKPLSCGGRPSRRGAETAEEDPRVEGVVAVVQRRRRAGP